MSTPDPEVDPLYGDKPWLPNAKETEREALAAIVRSNRSVNVPDAILAAGFRRVSESEIRRDLTVRPNPPMPSDETLHEIESDAIIGHWSGDVIALSNSSVDEQAAVGRRALWRHGCDAGMVAE